MSEENVRRAREANDAARRGDWEALAPNLDPHVLARTDPRWPEQHIYGREAVIAFWRGLSESVGTDTRIEEIMDLGDRILVRVCWTMHGEQSGLAGEQGVSIIETYREGRVILIEYFLEHEQALKAVGLEE